MTDATQARELFDRIAERYRDDPSVTEGTGFGSSPGLRVAGKIFAMLSHDELVVKLPAARVDALIANGTATRFDAGKGRPMREWATIPAGRSKWWREIADEAFAFVGTGKPQPGTR